MSKRSATMSVKRLALSISMRMSGNRGSHGSKRGHTTVFAACSVAVMRTFPAGLPRISPSTSSSASMSPKRWSITRNRRSPASVVETLRVVRFSSLSASRASSARTVWLRADCETPCRAAARVKLPSRTTAANAARSSKRGIDKPG